MSFLAIQSLRCTPAFFMLGLMVRYRRILAAITRVELAKRYSGSVFGKLWLILYPALLLSIYLFVYLVVFKVKMPEFGDLGYVLYVFCGLIPYIGFTEALNTGCHCVKQNMHLVKNVMLPLELIPVRAVAVSIVSQLVSMGILICLLFLNRSLTVHLLWLPVILLFQVVLLIGLVWVLSALAVIMLDISYFVNLFLLLVLFISPIGFKVETVPPELRFLVYLNPVYYMIEVYRSSMVYGQYPPVGVLIIYVGMCVAAFVGGSYFFRRFKNALADYE
jgi:lipopolysaccharide transport system permease protein